MNARIVSALSAAFSLLAVLVNDARADWSEIRQRVRSSILFIETIKQDRDGSNREVITSTGFVTSPNGYGLTTAHGLPRQTATTIVRYQASVGSRHSEKFPIEVIRREDDLDLALIVFPKVQEWRAVEAGESKRVPEDARLYVLGFPRSSDLASAEGLLSSHFGPGGKWQTTLPLDYGNSGGPVFDIAGRVIGIAAGGYDEARAMTFVIPFDYARPLHSMVASLSNIGAFGKTTGAAIMKVEFPFSFTVGHEDRRQIQEEFCVEDQLKAGRITPSVVSQSGSGTRLISVNPIPGRPNCFRLDAFVAGNGVDRVGPVIVNYRGRGWLTGKIDVEASLQK